MKNYTEIAANWWAEQIQKSNLGPVDGLEVFKKELSSEIRLHTNYNPSMTISTYKMRSNLLTEIAYHVGMLNINIPSGYEMRILFNNVFVYDSYGELVESF